MVNPSLAYEILLYINSFYFGLFATCELGTLILKSVLIIEKYDRDPIILGQDYGVLVGLMIVEAIRLTLGRKGSLSERAYEILLYINSFYFGLFATCELGTLILKSVLIIEKYDRDPIILGQDYGVLVQLMIVEAIRLTLGRKGSLSERDVPVMFSVVLTVPSIMGVLYLLIWQVVVLRIEYIWCMLMLSIQTLEFIFASMFIVTMCKDPSYD